jgi:hypothetical protein
MNHRIANGINNDPSSARTRDNDTHQRNPRPRPGPRSCIAEHHMDEPQHNNPGKPCNARNCIDDQLQDNQLQDNQLQDNQLQDNQLQDNQLQDNQLHDNQLQDDQYQDQDSGKEELLVSDLNRMSKKYKQYQANTLNGSGSPSNPWTELMESKNNTINDLIQELAKAKQDLVDLTIVYNNKIELLRTEHKRELNFQHAECMKKIKKIKQNI